MIRTELAGEVDAVLRSRGRSRRLSNAEALQTVRLVQVFLVCGVVIGSKEVCLSAVHVYHRAVVLSSAELCLLVSGWSAFQSWLQGGLTQVQSGRVTHSKEGQSRLGRCCPARAASSRLAAWRRPCSWKCLWGIHTCEVLWLDISFWNTLAIRLSGERVQGRQRRQKTYASATP